MEAWDGYWRKTPNVNDFVLPACRTRPRAPPRSRRGEIDIVLPADSLSRRTIQKEPRLQLVALQGEVAVARFSLALAPT